MTEQQTEGNSDRPAPNGHASWNEYWTEQHNQPWRTEPEIDDERQRFLAERHAIQPDIDQGIYPFRNIKLVRTDVEWLLATHKSGGMLGPVDWSDEQQRAREGLDLRGADLSGSDLHGLPLARLHASLTGRESDGPNQEQIRAAIAHFERASLAQAHLEAAYLSGGNLEDANLTGTSLMYAYLDRARLVRANLSQAQLQKASLDEAHLEHANLSRAHLEEATLSQAYLVGTRFFTTSLSDGYELFETANLERARLDKAYLQGANLQNVHLKYAQLGQAHLEGADLTGANLEGASLHWAYLEGAELGGRYGYSARANLKHASLLGAHLEGANLIGVNLEGANLSEALLAGTYLQEANLAGVNLSKGHLEAKTYSVQDADYQRITQVIDDFPLTLASANLRLATLDKNTRLNDAVLTGVLLDQIILDNTNLTVVKWGNVAPLGDELRARASKDSVGIPKSRQDRLKQFETAVRANRVLAVSLRGQGLTEDADLFIYRAQILQRQVLRRQHRYGAYLFSLLLGILTGYGYRLSRIIIAYLLMLITFALIYFWLGLPNEQATTTIQQLGNAFQVSLTAIHGRVFIEQFGIGSLLAWVAALESVVGLVIEGVFTAMLVQRFFAR